MELAVLRRRGQGWFLSFHCMTRYVKVAFFRGAALQPLPPGTSRQKDVRYLDIHEDKPFDEEQFVEWVKQASRLPGERMQAPLAGRIAPTPARAAPPGPPSAGPRRRSWRGRASARSRPSPPAIPCR
ncbi:hypothetical protein STVA_33320 [Allostella vacuolata]|nr:hypothetical protein STVA_33320 [Stella vacuolata]